MANLSNNQKKVLLVAPVYMGLYKDIVVGLESLGYDVTFYPDLRVPGDPFNKKLKDAKLSEFDFMHRIDVLWSDILQKDANQGVYDYLLVVDGLSVPPSLIVRLKKLNPKLVACNYLYDRIRGVYEVNRNFAYYDRIFSFDVSDVEEFDLHFLPIYWVPVEGSLPVKYEIFGFGGLDPYRLEVFRKIRKEARKIGKPSYIKIYYSNNSYLLIFAKNLIKRLLGRPGFTLYDFCSGLITNKALPPEDFRKMILSSNVVLDTNHPYQDGLTARFMWALGAEKKIITTNKSVRTYSFFSKKQIYTLNEDSRSIRSFLESDFKIDEPLREKISAYRVDKWLNTILTGE